MAPDAITTSRGGANVGAMAEKYAAINEALDTAEEGLVEAGLYDAQTARALFAGIRPPNAMDNVVGNLADLQRQPFMPPGFEQGATAGANPSPTSVLAGAPVEALGKTSAEKLADAGVTIPETPATSAEAQETMSAPVPGGAPTVIDDSGATAETPQSNGLTGMTKAELQAYADQNGISGVDQSNQTKDEMLAAIQAGG
jgi:hypothetical protein